MWSLTERNHAATWKGQYISMDWCHWLTASLPLPSHLPGPPHSHIICHQKTWRTGIWGSWVQMAGQRPSVLAPWGTLKKVLSPLPRDEVNWDWEGPRAEHFQSTHWLIIPSANAKTYRPVTATLSPAFYKFWGKGKWWAGAGGLLCFDAAHPRKPLHRTNQHSR